LAPDTRMAGSVRVSGTIASPAEERRWTQKQRAQLAEAAGYVRRAGMIQFE
jgi:hypothetical protein